MKHKVFQAVGIIERLAHQLTIQVAVGGGGMPKLRSMKTAALSDHQNYQNDPEMLAL